MAQKPKTLPFSRYALIFSALTVVLYLLFALLSYQQYHLARDALHASDVEGAQEELQGAANKALADLREGVASLSRWDEIAQQLNNPAYFTYWYTHRIQGPDGLDSRFESLMLYNSEGKALSRIESETLPHQIDPVGLQERYYQLEGDVLIHFFVPVWDSVNGRKQGYLGLSARLLPSVQRLHIFRLIDPQTLSFASNKQFETVEEILAGARFELLPTRRFALIDSLVSDVLITMGVLVVLPSLILVVTFTRFAGRAIRRVPEIVGLLREHGQAPPAELAGTLSRIRSGLQISELYTAEQFVIEYHEELSSTNAVLDEKNQELWTMAHQDALTGVRNRRAFDDYLETLQGLNQRKSHNLSLRLMLCDINHFKAINDSYGHQVGDGVLKGASDCLQRALRSNEMLFRLGGDEFACVLQDVDAAQAISVARRCESEVRNYPFGDLGLKEPVRLSIGISDATENGRFSIKELLRQADMAMYASKRPGSRSISVYDPRMAGDTGGIFSTSANEAVYRAIIHGEGVQMHYQPVRDTGGSGRSYYESLIRLERGGRLIYPGEIFPVVESRHLELDLDQAVIRQVLSDLEAGLIPEGTGVSVNLSAPSIVHDEVTEWLQPFLAFRDRYRLIVEVTETSLITQMDAARDNLAQMRRLGFLIALDDFGSGYSSLRYLTSMPVDIVKFDISLVHALEIPAQRRLVQHLVELIKDAGQQVVAEGIETEEMLEAVTQVGFHCVQGYLLGKPERLKRPNDPVSATPV